MSREADLDECGDIMSKHKGETGKTIDTSKMKCKNV